MIHARQGSARSTWPARSFSSRTTRRSGRSSLRALRSHGHDVAWERTGTAALAAGRCHGRVDLALLDLGLPDLDGVEVCRQLRRMQPGCVLVMLTARSAEMDVVVGLEAGADDYLVKPVRLAELHARIRAHLRRSDTGRPARPGPGDRGSGRRRAAPAGHRRRARTAPAPEGVRPAGPPGRPARGGSPPRDAHVRGVGRELVRLHQDPRRPRRGAPAEDRGERRRRRRRVPEIVTIRGHGYRLEFAPDARSTLPS